MGQALSNWQGTPNPVLLRQAEAPGPAETQATHGTSGPHTPSAGLTPGSAARSAAVSAPLGTLASPRQPPPWPAPGRSFWRSGATTARSGCTCGGDGRTGLPDRIAGRTQPASPQRRLPGGERATARTRPDNVSFFQIWASGLSGHKGEQFGSPTLLRVGVARCVSLPGQDLKNRSRVHSLG